MDTVYPNYDEQMAHLHEIVRTHGLSAEDANWLEQVLDTVIAIGTLSERLAVVDASVGRFFAALDRDLEDADAAATNRHD